MADIIVRPTAPLIKVAAGPRNARTDASGLRFYRWEERDLPSVTTIRRMAGLPFPLAMWQVNQVVNRAIDGYADLGTRLKPGDDKAILAAKTWLRKAMTEERDKSAALGKAVHDAAAEAKPLTSLGIDIVPFVRQYLHWQSVMRPNILATEQQCWNLTVGYAGTLDLLCRLPDGRTALVDLKTGKGTWPEHYLQLLGYATTEFIGEDDHINLRLTRVLEEVDTLAILHLRADKWEWLELDPTPDGFAAFHGLLRFAVWAHKTQTLDPLTLVHREGHAA